MKDAILAADIGGTKSWVSLYLQQEGSEWKAVETKKFRNAEYGDPYPLLTAYLDDLQAEDFKIRAIGLAVAGPVEGDSVDLTNLPWTIDAGRLGRQFDLDQVHLINDFQAAALGVSLTAEPDNECLNQVAVHNEGMRIITGAGTGLGLAMLTGENGRWLVHATEAGHADYAPGTEQQCRLLHYLRERLKFKHVTWENLLSGQGLVLMDAFIRDLDAPVFRVAETVTAAAERKDIHARHAIQLFWDVYAAWVGNVALMYRPDGGVYLFGGMAIRLSPWLKKERFLQEACERGGMQRLVEKTPMFLVTDELLGLKGAAESARRVVF